MNNIFIEIKNLSMRFPSEKEEKTNPFALNNINLNIPRGCIYGIIGMSGSGKSTLLRCLMGLELPSGGTIFFEGKEFPFGDAKALESLRRQIGTVFQHFHLFSSRTAASNIAYPLEIAGVSPSLRKERVAELLNLVNLSLKGGRYPSQLSGGEKQRICIARALASNPRVLLCDEPTSALDPMNAKEILQLLLDLNRTLGITIVMVSHALQAVRDICQRVAVLANGQVAEEGITNEIFNSPKHPATRTLLHLDAEYGRNPSLLEAFS